MLPEKLKKLAAQLANLPGIGPRQAIRIAIFIASGKKTRSQELIESLKEVSSLSRCTHCFLPYDQEGELCSICSDENRNQSLIAAVEKETDLLSLEQSNAFSGRYFIFGEINRDGSMSSDQEERIKALKEQIRSLPGQKAEEIILATSPSSFGDRTAELLSSALEGSAKKISRLGRGVPTGADLEFADQKTLSDALKNRN